MATDVLEKKTLSNVFEGSIHGMAKTKTIADLSWVFSVSETLPFMPNVTGDPSGSFPARV